MVCSSPFWKLHIIQTQSVMTRDTHRQFWYTRVENWTIIFWFQLIQKTMFFFFFFFKWHQIPLISSCNINVKLERVHANYRPPNMTSRDIFTPSPHYFSEKHMGTRKANLYFDVGFHLHCSLPSCCSFTLSWPSEHLEQAKKSQSRTVTNFESLVVCFQAFIVNSQALHYFNVLYTR